MGKTAQCWSWQPSPWDEFNLLNAVQEIEICRLSKSKFCSIIYDYFWAKHSSEKVLQLNCISYYDLKLEISIFLKIKRIITKLNKNISKRREPDYTNEVFLIKNYMEKHFGEKITLRNIYNEIKNSTENWKIFQKLQFQDYFEQDWGLATKRVQCSEQYQILQKQKECI